MSFEDTQATGDAAIKKLNGVIGRITSKLSPEELRQQNAEASRYQREAEGAIRKLETIAKDSPPTSRRGQMETISSLKASLNRARTDLQRSNDNAARGELLNKGDMKKVRTILNNKSNNLGLEDTAPLVDVRIHR